jgi:hypothetical protein
MDMQWKSTKTYERTMWCVLAVLGILGLLAATGCGSEPDSEGAEGVQATAYDDPELESELGTDAAAVIVRIGYGWRGDQAQPNEATSCTTQLAPAAQICYFPPSKTVRYRLDGTWTGSELTLARGFVDARVSAMNSQFGASGWAFSRSTAAGSEVVISKGALGSSSLSSILPYVGVVCQNFTTLTQPPGLSGTTRICNAMSVTVDLAKIDSSFTNATQRERVRGHAFGSAMSPGAGIGMVSSPVDRMHSIAITSGAAKFSAYDSVAACRVNGYDSSNPTVFDTGMTCP